MIILLVPQFAFSSRLVSSTLNSTREWSSKKAQPWALRWLNRARSIFRICQSWTNNKHLSKERPGKNILQIRFNLIVKYHWMLLEDGSGEKIQTNGFPNFSMQYVLKLEKIEIIPLPRNYSICHLWLCSDCKVQFMSLQSPFTWILIRFRSSATIEGRPDTVFCEIGNLAPKLTNLKPRQWFATIIYFNTWSIIHIPKIDFGTFFQKDKLNFPMFFVCVFSLSLWNKFFLIS